MRSLLVSIFALLLIGVSGCQPYPVKTHSGVSRNAQVGLVFSEHDRKLIRQYYGNNKQKRIPPGLAKKERLPPGLQKQINKNGKLPPGLEGRYLPHELEQRLMHLPNGYVRVRVGDDIVLLHAATRIIADVIAGVAF